jgi:hypothetical protein
MDDGTVRLSWTPCPDDLVEGFRAVRRTPIARVRLAAVFGVLALGAMLSLALQTPFFVTFMSGWTVAMLGQRGTAKLLAKRHFQSHALHTERNVAVVDDGGVTVSTPDMTTTTQWPFYSRFEEHEKSFVLIARAGLSFVALPKQGISDRVATAQLRHLLTEHLPPT